MKAANGIEQDITELLRLVCLDIASRSFIDNYVCYTLQDSEDDQQGLG